MNPDYSVTKKWSPVSGTGRNTGTPGDTNNFNYSICQIPQIVVSGGLFILWRPHTRCQTMISQAAIWDRPWLEKGFMVVIGWRIIYKLWQLLSKLRTNEWPHESRTGYLLSLLWLMIDGDTWGAAGSAWYSYWPGPGPPACPCPLHPLPVISCSPCNLTTDYYNIPWPNKSEIRNQVNNKSQLL